MEVVRAPAWNIPCRSFEVAVVIDVLRATTTAAVLLARGTPEIRIVASVEALASVVGGPGSWLVVSELDAARQFEPSIDNSPKAAREHSLDGSVPVLVTTNGTRAVDAVAPRAQQILLASFVNLNATTTYLRQLGASSVLVAPAGDFAGEAPRLEDDLCAEALVSLLAGRPLDFAAAAARIRDDARVVRRIQRDPSFAEDVELSLDRDAFPVAIVVTDRGGGTGFTGSVARGEAGP
jgi:2-phosphosulfolactate phosphatase